MRLERGQGKPHWPFEGLWLLHRMRRSVTQDGCGAGGMELGLTLTTPPLLCAEWAGVRVAARKLPKEVTAIF